MQIALQKEVGGFFLRRTYMSFKLDHFWFHGLDDFSCKILTQFFSGHMPCQPYYPRFNLRHVGRFPKPCSRVGEETPLHLLWCLDSQIVRARADLDNILQGIQLFLSC